MTDMPTGLKRWAQTLASIVLTQPRPQMAALCYRMGESGIEILLATSRNSGRWILPKGWPIEGLSAPETAAQEAYEEAGVLGEIAPTALGAYDYIKRPENGLGIACRVTVFALAAHSQAADFPEKGQRRYIWLSPEQAADLIDQPGLAEIVRNFSL